MKISNIFIGIIVVSAAITAYITGNRPTWSHIEKNLIEQSGDSIMRLYTIENKDDSLLLRQSCKKISLNDFESPIFAQLKNGMLSTVTNPQNEGVGIAAPQIGVTRRLIAVQRYDKSETPFEFYINPKIIAKSDSLIYGDEGCLSIPGYNGNVARSQCIIIEYNDANTFILQRDTIEDFTAVIFQHETDHLDGILYIDRASGIIKEYK